jgi:hypothetical protein
MRRLLALALAWSLVLVIARPAFAADSAEAPPEAPGEALAGAPLEQAPDIRPFQSAHFGLAGTVKFDGVTIDVLGEGDLVLPDRQRGTFKFGPVTAEVVTVGSTVYTRTRFEPTWSRQSGGPRIETGTISASEITRLGRDVRRIGVETVNGVATEHYTTTIDFSSVIEPLLPSIPEREAREALRSLTGTVDVWVGVQDRLVRQERLILSIRMPAIEPGGDPTTATIDLTMVYSRLNEPVTIAEPQRNDPSPIRTPRPDVVPLTGPAGTPAGTPGGGQGRPGAPAQVPAQTPRR